MRKIFLGNSKNEVNVSNVVKINGNEYTSRLKCKDESTFSKDFKKMLDSSPKNTGYIQVNNKVENAVLVLPEIDKSIGRVGLMGSLALSIIVIGANIETLDMTELLRSLSVKYKEDERTYYVALSIIDCEIRNLVLGEANTKGVRLGFSGALKYKENSLIHNVYIKGQNIDYVWSEWQNVSIDEITFEKCTGHVESIINIVEGTCANVTQIMKFNTCVETENSYPALVTGGPRDKGVKCIVADTVEIADEIISAFDAFKRSEMSKDGFMKMLERCRKLAVDIPEDKKRLVIVDGVQ